MIRQQTPARCSLLLSLVFLFTLTTAHAQNATAYQTPPKPLADLVTVPPTPGVSVTAKGDVLLILEQERTYWQAPEVYNSMSPFMNADKMKSPLLLIHGEADNNTGTFPIQSERYYNALKGFGATTKLVFLPYESHGYTAKESLLHMLWEMNGWLDTYVKNPKAVAPASQAGKLGGGKE